MKRAIHIFPQMESAEEICRIRKIHDPLGIKPLPTLRPFSRFTANIPTCEIC
ncbi:hypothetical protein DET59_12145 [Rossellomorea aquimaris]|uniref:Uncharacterized protein n=1 Tax=Rossellomorea aquimaris TaxID=189382 RepID=A0A366EFF4_9BACI|nr:hypothetical protein DET59_12145 [Rossellomorea aquimaris]